MTNFSSIECKAWTSPRHHKSGLHSHSAITKIGGNKEWVLNILLKEHDFAAFFRYTVGIRKDAKRLKDAPGLRGTHEEKGTRMVLARIVLPPLALESFTLIGLLLATMGALFLAYDLLGRENGPLRWFTLVLTCGLVSALVFVPVAMLDSFLLGGFKGGFNVFIILPLILFGALMGFYTVILVDCLSREHY
jgi:hypothetical protein